MARVKIVIQDADLAHEATIRSYRLFPDLQARLRREGLKRAAGTVHAVAETECPLGRPNCRDCGDPAKRESCREQGHCPQCGTAHGVAPTSVIEAGGYRLEED